MAAVGDIVTYVFTGEEERDERGRYVIPQNVTHLLFHESITVIPARLFDEHPNIVELICHVGVKRIETAAFYDCPRLRRLIIPGVEDIEGWAFQLCEAVTDIECFKLERILEQAFLGCESLSSINLLSVKVVRQYAFDNCTALTEAKFGKHLESIDNRAFEGCTSLERITIPLKNGLLTGDDIFQRCHTLKEVDLVEGAILQETADALLMEEWRNDMNAVIDSINHSLPNASAGDYHHAGEKALAIRLWIGHVLFKIIDYKAQHRHILTEASAELQLMFPSDVVMNNVLPFLELPSYKFEGEEDEEDEESNSDDDSENVGEGV